MRGEGGTERLEEEGVGGPGVLRRQRTTVPVQVSVRVVGMCGVNDGKTLTDQTASWRVLAHQAMSDARSRRFRPSKFGQVVTCRIRGCSWMRSQSFSPMIVEMVKSSMDRESCRALREEESKSKSLSLLVEESCLGSGEEEDSDFFFLLLAESCVRSSGDSSSFER